jgi:hypothetical protein
MIEPSLEYRSLYEAAAEYGEKTFSFNRQIKIGKPNAIILHTNPTRRK